MTTTNAPTPTAPLAPAPVLRKCLCGCGGLTAGLWCPGHDGKAHGLLRSVARGEKQLSSLPESLAAVAADLAVRWNLGTKNEDGTVAFFSLPTSKKRPADQHKAVRTLLKAKAELADRPELAELIAEVLEDLTK